MICYIAFEPGAERYYAYTCGGLQPEAGDLVVVTVGKENKLRIVTCMRTSHEHDPLALKEIFGLVQTQPVSKKGDPSIVRP